MMNDIIIDGYNFTTLEAMKYWSHPKSYDINKKREESKYMCTSGNYLGARKMDGAWNMIIKDSEGNYHLRSRTESVNGGYTNKAEWIPWIIAELNEVPNGTVLLGEIYFPDNEGSRKITSVLNCLKDKCIERQKKSEPLHYYIFDILAYGGKNIMKESFSKRINTYLNNLSSILNNKAYITIAEYKTGEELWNLYGEVIACGGEGIVITREDCQYMEGKRTARMTLKMKKELEQTIDVYLSGKYNPSTKLYTGKSVETWTYWLNTKTGEKVNENKFIAYTNGEAWEPITKGYYHGWASAVEICMYGDNNTDIHIGYISGIPDEMKRDIVAKPEKYFHKVYEVTAMEVECIDGNYSLRHAKFVGERTDKDWKSCDFNQIA